MITLHTGDIDYVIAKQNLQHIASLSGVKSSWYEEANQFANSLAELYNQPFDVVCKVIALLSPLVKWDDNKRRATRVFDAWQDGIKISCHIGKTMKKVYTLLENNDTPDNVLFGPKTLEFYQTILDPTHAIPTIDSHAISILIGLPYEPGSYKFNQSIMELAQNIYCEVANELNISPTQLQASTWEYVVMHKEKNRGNGIKMLELFDSLGVDSICPYQFANIYYG